MKTIVLTFLACCLLFGPLYGPTVQSAEPNDMFLIRITAKTPEAVVQAVKAYAEGKKWQYLGANKVKQGQVTLVKICIPEVGQQIWPVGLHLSALLPCGNLGVYQKEGKTEISLLRSRYMQVLYPHPAIEKASATAQPLLTEMLDAVVK
jgi:uncharacterized protein (DUF302 family)